MKKDSFITNGDDQIGQIADEILARIESGETPDIDEYVRKFPHLAGVLRKVLPALLEIGSTACDEQRSDQSRPRVRQVLGDFRLVRELGSGGMGFVYEAEQLSMGRSVALKILPMAGALQKKSLQRFRNEVRAAAMLDHPHIVSVYFVGEDRGVHYYAMQLIRGRTMATVIRELTDLTDKEQQLGGDSISQVLTESHRPDLGSFTGVRLKDDLQISAASETTMRELQAEISTLPRMESDAEYFRSAARLGIQAAEAVQHAHDQGVLHRDIKPANLLLDEDANLYVADFGLARIETDVGMTMTGDLVGTLRYMSPEQALAKRVVIDHRSDIYSLGVTFYELLTLRPAFDATNRQALLNQLASKEPVRPRQHNRAIPKELETITLKAMAKDRFDRYATAQDFADDLHAFLDHRPIGAKPPSVMQRVTKWSRRHRAIVLASSISAAIVLTTAIVALAVSHAWVSAERDQKSAALKAKSQALDEKAEALAKADENLGKALRAIDDMLNQVSDQLGATPGATPLRRDLLEDALALCQELLEDTPENPAVRFQAAKVRHRLGNVYGDLGHKLAAQHQFREAIAMLESLVKEDPSESHYRFSLAIAYLQLSWHTPEKLQKREYCAKAVALCEAVVQEHPRASEYKSRLLDCYTGLALRTAGTDLRAANDILEKAILVGEADTDVARGRLANCYRQQAAVLKGLGKEEAAEVAYLNAIECIRQELQSPSPLTTKENLVHFRRVLAATMDEYCRLLLAMKRMGDAVEYNQKAIDIWSELTYDFPLIDLHRRQLQKSTDSLERLMNKVGQSD